MQGFSQSLRVILVSCVHPDESRATLTSPANLNEDQVTSFARSAHLVPVPGDHRPGVVSRTDNLQLAHTDIRDATLQSQYVLADHATPSTNFLRQDVDRPH